MLRQLLSPRLVGLHLVGLVAVCATALLGWWQYDAWQTARATEARDLATAKPLPLDDVLGPNDPFPGDAVGRPVRVQGAWVAEESFLVSGREHDRRSGFWVVTPAAVCRQSCANAPAMLVVRGWTPSANVPAAPRGEVRLVGWLQPPEDSARTDVDPADDVLPEVSIADAVQRVDRDLYGGYVVAREVARPASAATATAEAGLEPVSPASLPEPSTSTSLRNLLYALEWWVFGAFAAFVWWRWARDAVQARPGSTASSDAGPLTPGTAASERGGPVPPAESQSPTAEEPRAAEAGVASKP